jgi:hypothetical protein
MNLSDILQWIVQAGFGGVLLWVALRKAPNERELLKGDGSQAFANAAQIAASLNEKYAQRISDLEAKIQFMEECEKDYSISIEFRTSTPPQVKEVKILPVEKKEK